MAKVLDVLFPDQPLQFEESEPIQEFLESSIRSAIKKAFEATAVEEKTLGENNGRFSGVHGWNAALAEKRKKETDFLKPLT